MVSNILSWLIWLPVAGMVAILFIPREKADVIKIVAAVATGLQLWLAIMVWLSFDTDSGIFQNFLKNQTKTALIQNHMLKSSTPELKKKHWSPYNGLFL